MHKLVRDNILAITRARGEEMEWTRWAQSNKMDYLAEKLVEEAIEFQEDRNIEELADTLEVIYGIITASPSWTWTDLETVREGKRVARGAFEQGLILTAPIPSYEARKLPPCMCLEGSACPRPGHDHSS